MVKNGHSSTSMYCTERKAKNNNNKKTGEAYCESLRPLGMYKLLILSSISKYSGLFDVHTSPPSPDEQPVIYLCKTSKPPGQQTIVVLISGQYTFKNVLYYRMNPLDK